MSFTESSLQSSVEFSAAVLRELQASHATIAELEAARRRIRGLLRAAFPANWDPSRSTTWIDVIALEILSNDASPSTVGGVTQVVNETARDVILKVGNGDPDELLPGGHAKAGDRCQVIPPRASAWIARRHDSSPALVCQAVGIRYVVARPTNDERTSACEPSGWERGCRADGRATSIHVGWPRTIIVRENQPNRIDWWLE